MNKTKIEDDQRYKLLSEGERRFLEIPESELGVHYKRPDLAKKQFLLKIRYRTVNAIKEIVWLCDKLPENQLKKIFTDNHIEELFKISEKALGAADWKLSASLQILEKIKDKSTPIEYYNELREESRRTKILEDHVKNLMPHYLSTSEITSFQELIKKYISFLGISNEISKLNSEFHDRLRESNSLSEFIKAKGLEKDFETYRSDLMKKQDAQWDYLIERLKTPGGREELKSKHGFTDEQIENLRKLA